MGLSRRSTHATPPAFILPPSMRRASSCTFPSDVRKLPRPASNVGSSSKATTAASTASRAEPPWERIEYPVSSALRTPAWCACASEAGIAQAPPCTRRVGTCEECEVIWIMLVHFRCICFGVRDGARLQDVRALIAAAGRIHIRGGFVCRITGKIIPLKR